ncbi:DNA recombination protein RmuC [Methylovirgula sp. 4M-Z18]|nr:DNA recombination protein RmuC [Methylovirgula sp. 4M-Z18]
MTLSSPVLTLGSTPVTVLHLLVLAVLAMLGLLLVLATATLRANRERDFAAGAEAERSQELDERLGEINKANAELAGRLATMAEVLTTRQSDLARYMAERLDAVGTKVGQGLEQSSKTTAENLTKLNERLAVIDAAQNRLTGLTEEVVTLKDILANKQTRGAFGQSRMEAIIRDGLPPNAFEFQATLKTGVRPDCLIRLPNDERGMAIDAKFPLEGFTALREAETEEERRGAIARVRGDVGKHVKDIAERYLVPGVTQDIAVMFVPSESIFADLHEYFDDVVQRAHRARITIVSPSLLMMAVQVIRSIMRDARMREEAHRIQDEVGKLLDDVRRLGDRVGKLDDHFRQAQKDVSDIVISSNKVLARGEKIQAVEFEDAPERTAPATTVKFPRAAE